MSKSNIDWCTHTLNIITGCLGPEGDGKLCPYCYAAPFAKRIYHKALGKGKEFAPHFWKGRLNQFVSEKEPCRIFMNSMGDAFGDWVPLEWIREMLIACAGDPRHTYYFLTKNPKRYSEDLIRGFFEVNPNFWMGFTAETGKLYHQRLHEYRKFPDSMVSKQSFVSIEPMFDGKHKLNMYNIHPGWVIVGAQTKPDMFPSIQWVENIHQQCDNLSIPLFMKDSLAELYRGKENLVREIP